MSPGERRRPGLREWLALAALAALLAACGRYGPPQRAPQYREGYVAPAAERAEEHLVEEETGQAPIDEEEVPEP